MGAIIANGKVDLINGWNNIMLKVLSQKPTFGESDGLETRVFVLRRSERRVCEQKCSLDAANAAQPGLEKFQRLDALVQELTRGRFSAYLDVFATEPLALDHPFRRMATW